MNIVKLAINSPTRFKISNYRRLRDFRYVQKLMLRNTARTLNIPHNIIYRKKLGTNFESFHKILKLISATKLSSVAEIFSISEESLKTQLFLGLI